jgi:hypothetical protein
MVQRLLRPIGGDRSAMNVVLKGWRGGRAVTRCWTVFAEKGDGPWIPSLAVPLLADRLAAGHVPPVRDLPPGCSTSANSSVPLGNSPSRRQSASMNPAALRAAHG